MKETTEVEVLPAIIQRSAVVLAPVMNLEQAKDRLREFQQFVDGYLSESNDGGQDGGDYGVIPGTKKKTLLKSGADKLCELYGLYDEYQSISTVEDWDRGLFDYTLKCILKSRRDDSMVGTGVGSCSSWESKYRWRDSQRKCPKCGKENIRKSTKDDGWYCWTKTGGCGAKFNGGDASIEKQVIGRVENPDIIDMKNTVLKIAKKRAKIDAVIGVTRSSGIFAQDLDEIAVSQPQQKPIPTTDKDIEFGGPAAPGSAERIVEGTPSAQTAEDIYVDQGMATNFEVSFKHALRDPKKKAQASKYAHDWLRSQEIFKPGTTEPSAYGILRKNWFNVKNAAIEFARSL